MRASEVFALSTADLEEMSRGELARAVSTVASVANKRIKRLMNYGLDTGEIPALQLGTHPNRFSVAGKDKDSLMNELLAINEFMNEETSTITGYKDTVGQVAEKLNIGDRDSLTLDEMKTLGKTIVSYKKMREYSPDIQEKVWKYRLLKSVTENIEGINLSENEIRRRLEELYGEWYETSNADYVDSDFFEVEED